MTVIYNTVLPILPKTTEILYCAVCANSQTDYHLEGGELEVALSLHEKSH